ncbi:bifunctional proline dehydrogenase/L-glutamate gamma-semialdehyde dehydrogenase [Frankia sp. R43]|uniref:proline dehydrogenase family protein n=1 Tax=Frankia sp. R43 TaxID=269536 RepID=UPI0009F98662|nr:bifunctional proline dehydrogenase/L-glutamate gamma-semialdehyde dehydrogenase [Frankia sp. R43]
MAPATGAGDENLGVPMTAAHSTTVSELSAVAEEAGARARRWAAEAADEPVDAAAARLAGVLREPGGLAFTVGFVDGVIRPEDRRVAARNLARLAPSAPGFLPWYLRAAVRAGGVAGPVAPGLVIPVARRALRGMVGHLLVDATERRLGPAISAAREPGVRLNLNLLGEAVLGEREAARRLAGTMALVERPDVDHVSIKVSAGTAPHAPWAFEETVAQVVDALHPLYARAAATRPATFVNLDMEEYRDLDLTISVFTRLLDRPDLRRLEAGIVLQAYLPDALGALVRLGEWSTKRVSAGGAPITVRIVKGANLPMEHVEASLRGWPAAPYGSKEETDANYKRLLDHALRPERVDAVRIGVAGHNLFDLAFAWVLAGRRGVRGGLRFEMLRGMAQAQARVVAREVGGLLLYTPAVRPAEFDVAIAYLVRRLEEGASQENFLSAMFDLAGDNAGGSGGGDGDGGGGGLLFAREERRFRASVARLEAEAAVPPAARRTQNRQLRSVSAPDVDVDADVEAKVETDAGVGFRNAPDTDPSLAANRAWARRILARAGTSALGADLVERAAVRTPAELDDVLAGAVAAGPGWAALGGAGRAKVLRRAADQLESRRAELIEVMVAEAGKTFDQADPEVSEAADFARYYADRAVELDHVDGAVFTPARLAVVTPPWNFPVAIPAGSTLAALAAGSPVVLKPAGQTRRCGAVLTQALWDAGVPRDVLQLVYVDEGELGRALVSDPRVERVLLTGAFETAQLFRSWRHDLPLLAETSGKNAIVVTPSADVDLAVRDVVASAFGHAGQKCSAASLLVLVGSAARSRRLHDQLVDAVRSLAVGPAHVPTSQMGPLVEPAAGKLLRALTTLGPGERWIVEPRRLDGEGRLWSPGVRTGVARGSEFHRTEYFGPVLGIMAAPDLATAVELQNGVDFGLTAGLHSRDRAEIEYWLRHVEAGNLYVNRGITGAIVGRQPFGGWKRSAVGPGTKAGGPSYLLALGTWASTPSTAADATPTPRPTPAPAPVAGQLLAAVRRAPLAGEAAEEIAGLERALRSDAAAWTHEYGVAREVGGLVAERNVLRYRPVPVEVRLVDDGFVALVRVVAAGLLAGSAIRVTAAVEPPAGLGPALRELGVPWRLAAESEWLAEVARAAARGRELRVRVTGRDADALARAARALADVTRGRPGIVVHAGPVTESGRLELLPFLREQSISVTAHRFGAPDDLVAGLV